MVMFRFLGAVALVLAAGCAGETDALVERVNAYRSSAQMCAGKPTANPGPLAPSPVLARVNVSANPGSLPDALKQAGYSAAQAQAVVISGPFSARSAMKVLEERYCEVLTSPQFSEIGISREGRTWRIVLAQPLLSSSLGDSFDAGKEVLELVNKARAAPRSCGSQRFGAVHPLQWNAKLAAAALAHSTDMAKRNYVAHAAPDGSKAGERADRAGYKWHRIGENIASGQGSPSQVVAGWLASPDHCANIMQADFSEMGAAYVVNADDTMIYWTQVFGMSRR